MDFSTSSSSGVHSESVSSWSPIKEEQDVSSKNVETDEKLKNESSKTHLMLKMGSSSAASASVSKSIESSAFSELKRKSKDVGWDYAILSDPNRLDRVKCILCGKVMCGGIYRLKQHIAHVPGNVAPCAKSTKDDQIKCKNAINEGKVKKKSKQEDDKSLRSEVQIGRNNDEIFEVNDLEESFGSMRVPHTLGPMDKFANSINPESSLDLGKSKRDQNISNVLWKERFNHVKEYICRWAYECAIPFHAFEKDSFKLAMEACGQFGPGAQPPTRYEMSETFLKKEVDRTKTLMKTHEDEWKKNGCSIMTDAWSDRKRRSIMNLYVNSRLGTVFLSSKDSSNEADTSEHNYEYVERCIQEVGPENVIQIVTDNASNNTEAAKLLNEKRPKIFWTSCAAHTINLMLEGIGGLHRFKKVLDQAKTLTVFIYAHHKTLALMRHFTKKRDIVRPGVTRFASAFLTLQSLAEKKSQLRHMFSSTEWEECKFSKTVKGKSAYATVLSTSFWAGVTLCLKVFAPLVKVLRMVDGDLRPSMGFVYGQLLEARKDIMGALGNCQKTYGPIMDIISSKMKGRLDSSLHLMAYLLNPYYHYKDSGIQDDSNVMVAVLDFVEILFVGDMDMQHKILFEELPKYKNKDDMFGRPIATKACEVNDDKFDPANWWGTFGVTTPHLKKIAMRILSLTTSSSGCERNWSTFEGIHTKKRNRLQTEKLNNLVYVQFNANLMNKHKREKERNIEVLLASDASEAQEWIVDGDGDEVEPGLPWQAVSDALGTDEVLQPRRSSRLRELSEEEFESDSEEEVNEIEYESDEERILEQYGQDDEQPTNANDV